MTSGVGLAQSQNQREIIHPSSEGTASERVRPGGVPLPEGSPFSGTVEMGHPNSPREVRAVQRELKERGYAPGAIDGLMGEQTREAIKHFQNDNNIEVTGTLNSETAQKLGVELQRPPRERATIHPDPNASIGGTASERARRGGVPLPEGSPYSGTVEMGHANSLHEVRAAQRALREKGYDPGPIDGMMGAQTRQAIKNFQNDTNLETTGTLDSDTAQKLGVEIR